MSAGFHGLRVTDVRRETEDSVSLAFALPPELIEAFRFDAGQHLTLRTEIAGEDIRRNYSLCVAPHERELRVAIKHIDGGVFSKWANRDIAVDDVIEVMPPHGSFTWRFDSARAAIYAGFAAGSGITPVLSLLKTALDAEPNSRFTLFYGNRATSGIMFLDEIADLKDRYLDRLQVCHFLDEEEGEIEMFNGRLDAGKMADVLQVLIDPAEIDAAFICGPGPMMDGVEAGLTKAGVAVDKIRIERFTVDRMSEADLAEVRARERRASGRKIQVVLDGRKRTLAYDADRGSILDNARAAGMPVPFACKAGVCATCRARLVSGEIHMNANYGLSAEEVAQGYVLTCQAVPQDDDVVLNYDT